MLSIQSVYEWMGLKKIFRKNTDQSSNYKSKSTKLWFFLGWPIFMVSIQNILRPKSKNDFTILGTFRNSIWQFSDGDEYLERFKKFKKIITRVHNPQ